MTIQNPTRLLVTALASALVSTEDGDPDGMTTAYRRGYDGAYRDLRERGLADSLNDWMASTHASTQDLFDTVHDDRRWADLEHYFFTAGAANIDPTLHNDSISHATTASLRDHIGAGIPTRHEIGYDGERLRVWADRRNGEPHDSQGYVVIDDTKTMLGTATSSVLFSEL